MSFSRELQHEASHTYEVRETFQEATRLNLIAPARKEDILAYSKYFSVPKTREVDRAIFNGKRFSTLCRIPPKVNLPTYREILRRMEELAILANGNVYCVTGDWRNEFHALSFVGQKAEKKSRSASDYFGLAIKMGKAIEFYKWMGAPMGFSWSLALAQACAWTMLTATVEGDKAYFDNDVFQDALPTVMPIQADGVVKGYVCVYYDNYLGMTVSEEIAKQLDRRWRRVEAPIDRGGFNMKIKEGSHRIIGPQDKRHPTRCLEYLGIQICITGGDHRPWSVRWCSTESKIKQYCEAGTPFTTAREFEPNRERRKRARIDDTVPTEVARRQVRRRRTATTSSTSRPYTIGASPRCLSLDRAMSIAFFHRWKRRTRWLGWPSEPHGPNILFINASRDDVTLRRWDRSSARFSCEGT